MLNPRADRMRADSDLRLTSPPLRLDPTDEGLWARLPARAHDAQGICPSCATSSSTGGSWSPRMTCFPNPFLAALQELEVRRLCEEVSLAGLDEPAVGRLDHRLPPAVARFIHARTGGHPLFMLLLEIHVSRVDQPLHHGKDDGRRHTEHQHP